MATMPEEEKHKLEGAMLRPRDYQLEMLEESMKVSLAISGIQTSMILIRLRETSSSL